MDLASEAVFGAQQQRIVAPVCTDVVNHMEARRQIQQQPRYLGLNGTLMTGTACEIQKPGIGAIHLE